MKRYDYSSAGWYFVTLCTRNREELFVPRVSKRYGHRLPPHIKQLSVAATHASPEIEITDIVEKCLLEVPEHYPTVEIDFYVFVQDHLHIIFYLKGDSQHGESELSCSLRLSQGGACPAATDSDVAVIDSDLEEVNPKLGTVVGSFKSAASKLTGQKLWQPNYYEHVIRNEIALQEIREYILKNPYVEYEEINWKKLDR